MNKEEASILILKVIHPKIAFSSVVTKKHLFAMTGII